MQSFGWVAVLELDWLQTFVVAAEERNFRRAADRLHLAQPTVSLHIAKLEQVVGAPLFERSGRGVGLSQAGQRFFGHAKTVLASYHTGLEDMARWQAGYAETLTVAVSPLVATTWFPYWLRSFSAIQPTVEFNIRVTESPFIAQHVASGEVDIGFSRQHQVHPDVTQTPLYEDEIVLCAPQFAGASESGEMTAALDVLADYTLFSYNHPHYWDDLMPKLRRLLPQLRTMRVSLVHVSLAWIMEGLGVSFLPYSTVRRALLQGTVREVPFVHFDLPVARTYLVCKSQTRSLAAAFAAHVEHYMQARATARLSGHGQEQERG